MGGIRSGMYHRSPRRRRPPTSTGSVSIFSDARITNLLELSQFAIGTSSEVLSGISETTITSKFESAFDVDLSGELVLFLCRDADYVFVDVLSVLPFSCCNKGTCASFFIPAHLRKIAVIEGGTAGSNSAAFSILCPDAVL